MVYYGFFSSHVWSWTVKKAECQRIPGFRLWCWRQLLRVTWTARKSKQWILKEIIPEYFLEGLMLKLKLLEPTHWKKPWWWETLKAKGEGGSRRWDGWVASPNQWIWIWAQLCVLQFMGLQKIGYDLLTEQQKETEHLKHYSVILWLLLLSHVSCVRLCATP